MKLNATYLLLTLCCLSLPRLAQAQRFNAANANGQRLFVCMDDLDNDTRSNLKAKGISSVLIMYNQYIDPDLDLKLNEDVFVARIKSMYPGATDKGMGVIDWEPAGFDHLKPSDPKFIKITAEMEKMVRLAKKTRPNVKWSFYGLPFREYLHFTDAWRQKCYGLIPVLKQCDFLAPSMYSFLPNSLKGVENKRYVDSNMAMSLRIGAMLNKPVYPFVWHRWHDGNKQYGLTPIPMSEFQGTASRILSRKYNNRRVSGLIWWGAEKYFYNHKNPRILQEAKSFRNLKDYQENTLDTYSAGLLKLFTRKAKVLY